MLESGEEENGFTILRFSRDFVTCDQYDLPITVSHERIIVNCFYSDYMQAETARAIWSFHATTDPTSEVLTFADIHSHKGALSLNLLGGLPDAAPDPQDLDYYDVTINNVSIVPIATQQQF